jgi:hypothetical protein
MKLVEEIFGRFKRRMWIRCSVAVAFCCFVCGNGFAQLDYLTDSRSVSGTATLNISQYQSPPYFVSSYSPFSGSAMPSAPFADFDGNAGGTATFVGGFTNPVNHQVIPASFSASLSAGQNSFLHPQELSFTSGEFGSSSTDGGLWSAMGTSSLQVTFTVTSPMSFNLSVLGTGNPLSSWDSYNLSSSSQGVLASGDTGTMRQAQDYGVRINYSGTFSPEDVYTLTLDSQGGYTGMGFINDGGGLVVDMTVPEPSVTGLAGLAFLIFLRANRIDRKGAALR